MNKKILRKSFIIVLLISVCLVGLNSAFAADTNISSEGSDLQVSEISNDDVSGEVAIDPVEDDSIVSDDVSSNYVDLSSSNSIDDSVSNYGAAYEPATASASLDLAVSGYLYGSYSNIPMFLVNDPIFISGSGQAYFNFPDSYHSYYSPTGNFYNAVASGASITQYPMVTYKVYQYYGVPSSNDFLVYTETCSGYFNFNHMFNPGTYYVVANMPAIAYTYIYHFTDPYTYNPYSQTASAVSPAMSKTCYFNIKPLETVIPVTTDKNQYYSGDNVLISGSLNLINQQIGKVSGSIESFNINLHVSSDSYNRDFNIRTDTVGFEWYQFSLGNYSQVISDQLLPGHYSVSAEFYGQNWYSYCKNLTEFDVLALPTNINISVDKETNYDFENSSISVSLKDVYNRSVVNNTFTLLIKENGVVIDALTNLFTDDQGIAHITLPILNESSYVLEAIFNGDRIYSASNNQTTLDILGPIDSNIDIFVDNSLSFVNDENKIFGFLFDENKMPIDNADIIVNIFDAFGNLVFENNNSIKSNNYYEVLFKNLTAGNYTAVATYPGTALIKGSNASCNFEILPLSSSIDIWVDNSLSFVNEENRLSGSLFDQNGMPIDNADIIVNIFDAFGNLVFENNNSIANSTSYEVFFNNLAAGNYTAVANYFGNSGIKGSNASCNFEILPLSSSIDVVTDKISYYEDEIIEVSGLLINAINGNLIDGANVLITLTDNNGVLTQVTAVTDAFGNYYYNFTNLYSNEYNVLVEFIGNSSIIGSNANTSFDVIANLPVVPVIPNGTDPEIHDPVIPNSTNITNETEDVNETPVVPVSPVVPEDPVVPVSPVAPEEPFVANATEPSVVPVIPDSNNPNTDNGDTGVVGTNPIANGLGFGIVNDARELANADTVSDNVNNVQEDNNNADENDIGIDYGKLIPMKSDNSWATLFAGLVGIAGLTEYKRREEDDGDE